MRLAICISGFLRTWEYSKPSLLKNLIQNNDYDLFIHTYKQNYFEYSSGVENKIYDEEEILKMFKDTNVKKIVIEDRDDILNDLTEHSQKYKDVSNFFIKIKESSDTKSKEINLGIRIYDQLRKNYLVNNLRKEYEIENNIKYDFYVKTRFDILYADKINWSNFNDDKIIYNGNCGTAGFPDDLIGIGTNESVINAYMDRFINLDKMCFTKVNKNEINPINWYPNFGDSVFPIKEFCAHDTLLRNIVYNGFDIKNGGFRNMVIRNQNSIVNWTPNTINGVNVSPVKLSRGIIPEGGNSYFDVDNFNKNLI